MCYLPFLSIVIPAYNAEHYIERCLMSISQGFVSQKLYKDEIEVIIIDDSSQDNTYSIANIIAAKTDVYKIRVIKHPQNMKQGAARNTGLRAAKGEYVWFVDVDDFINSEILSYCDSELLSCNPDVFQFHAKTLRIDGSEIIEPYITDIIGPINGVAFLEFEAKHKYTNRIRASWSKWYRRNYLIDNKLYYQEGIFWEDVVHTLKSIYLAKSILFAPIIAYNYVLTPNSDMRGAQNGRKLADTIRFCADSCKFLNEQEASSLIIESLSPYYNKVLRKYRLKLKTLDRNGIEDFCAILQSIDLQQIPICLKTDEHNWLMNHLAIISNWETEI